jgi:hypothetical protein
MKLSELLNKIDPIAKIKVFIFAEDYTKEVLFEGLKINILTISKDMRSEYIVDSIYLSNNTICINCIRKETK